MILAVTKPLGVFMARVFAGERTFLHPVLRPLERLIYRLGGVREDVEQRWTGYAGALLAFTVAKFLFTYLIQRLQGWLPLNPQGFWRGASEAGSRLQHRDQLRDEHELAGLRRRGDAELPRPDGRA